MKKATAFLAVLMIMVALVCAGCGCDHQWIDADCLNPLTCQECGEVAGAALGHSWVEASCTAPKTCSRCKETKGAALGHKWVDATCTTAKTCTTCNETEGTALGHKWSEATCTTPKTCKTCNETEGTARSHEYQETVTKQPSCDSKGVKTFTCNLCRDSYTEEMVASSYNATEIYSLFENSLGEIITYNSKGEEVALGTCFVYSSDGKLVTNFHVIDGAYSAKVTIAGKSYDIRYVLAYDRNIDLAVLKINATGLKPVTVCKKSHATGATIFAFGSSRGLSHTLSRGIITHTNREIDGVNYVQHDAAISGGNSGGPLINQYGEVIGINTMTVKDSQNLNFAINVNELDNLKYGTQLTMKEFYSKECNPYLKLKNYIVENGTYFTSSGGYYRVLLGTQYSSDRSTKYARYAFYYVSDDEITLDLVIDDGDYWLYMTIDDNIDGAYDWDYFDDNDYEIRGTIYATTFTEDTLLGYSYNNISYSSLRSSVRELASNMMVLLLRHIDTDFSAIGLTAEDLGFYYF